MRIIGLAGWSGSGKTTLIKKLIPCLIARGLSVSTLKHAHHGFDLDQPGKDSFFHRAAGATEVIISSAKRWAILHELREQPEWDMAGLVGKMSPVDLVLVEGFKRDAFPKLEIHRQANGKPLIHPEDPHIVAIASDIALPQAKVPVVDLDDIEAIADLLLKHAVPVGAGREVSGYGATHRRLFRVFRPAAAAARHGAADRRARRAGRRDRTRGLARRARPRHRQGRAWRRSICRRSIIRRSTATPCATPILRATAIRGSPIAGRLTAGARAEMTLKPGQAIRIFTGAAMPKGADTVFMQEDVSVEGDHVVVPKGLKLGSNRRLAGEDVAPARWCCRPAPCSSRSTSRLPQRSASSRSRCAAGSTSRFFPRAMRWWSPARRAAARRSTTPTAICSPNCWSGWAPW